MSTWPVDVPAGDVLLAADLTVPPAVRGLVVFAHGSGSSRHSPRNRLVASGLQTVGFATLLMDLLTAGEEALDRRNGRLRFDIDLLAARVVAAVDWARSGPAGELPGLPLALFGASTGAAAALVAAARRPQVAAVVSRGGRPDLAAAALADVRAPTLLVVGSRDELVLGLNRLAAEQLRCPREVSVVPDATHLFEEPGALERVVELAVQWLSRWLT